MKKVLLLGASGMLGSAVYNVLKDKYSLVLSFRNLEDANLLDKAYGGVDNHQKVEFDLEHVYQDYLSKKGNPGEYFNKFLNEIGEVDYVINAIGITIPFSLKNPALTFFINSAFPFILSGIFGSKLIHITTDCAFDGQKDYPYDEESVKTPFDIYGFSKAIGEPTDCLTLRTSIIGRELKGFTGLLEWFLKQKGETINGFTNHFWNGVTTKEFGKICDRIMDNREEFPETGIYHVFSNTVSKYEMVTKFKEKYNIDCEIVSDDIPRLNRTLSTKYPMCQKLNIPSFDKMLEEL